VEQLLLDATVHQQLKRVVVGPMMGVRQRAVQAHELFTHYLQ
jgi:hypothetical protein